MKKTLYIASAILVLGGMSLPAISLPDCQISSGDNHYSYLTPPNGQTACQTTALSKILSYPEVNARIVDGFWLMNWSNDGHQLVIFCGNDENNSGNYVMTTTVLKQWPIKSPIYQIICTKKATSK